MKKIIKSLFNRKAGTELSKNHNGSDSLHKNKLLENLFSILDQIKFIPTHIIDVGANHGSWTRETIKFFPDAYYTLIEPQAKMQASIQDLLTINDKVTFHALGAGSKSGILKFTIVDRDDSCTFSFSEAEASKAGFTQIDVPVITLNEFIPTLGKPIPDIIKIDAEGLDLEVLSGADNYFGTTEIFLVEAGVMAKQLDNSVGKVIHFMETKGYRLFDITDMNRTEKHNALWLLELVFIKKDGVIDRQVTTYI